MIKACILLAIALPMSHSIPSAPECAVFANATRVLNLSISHKKNLTGHWVTTASGFKDSDGTRRSMDLEINHGVVECGGGKFVSFIQGILSESPLADRVEKFYFHPRCGRNAALTNERRTAFRKSEDENHGVVLTDRPLKKNEIMEIRLDKISTKTNYNLGIGIMTHSPNDLSIPDHMLTIKSGTWMYYDKRVFKNGNAILHEYGRNLDDNSEFQVGDRIGVLVTDSGVLHFYVNNIDMGPAASNIPHSVYGVVEIRGKAMQVSIIEQSSPLP